MRFCFVFSFHAWLSCPPIQLLDDDVIRLLCCHLMCCVEIWTMEYRWVLQLLWCLVWITWLIIWNKTIWNYSWHRYYYCLLERLFILWLYLFCVVCFTAISFSSLFPKSSMDYIITFWTKWAIWSFIMTISMAFWFLMLCFLLSFFGLSLRSSFCFILCLWICCP